MSPSGDGLNASFTYDIDGNRISKTVNGIITDYIVIDGTLAGEITGENKLAFLYDESGTKYGFVYNGATYFYNLNLQGDVVGIYDSTGAEVVTYTYDEWGKILSVTGTLAGTIGQTNPIRYRGYYYDDETGFYATGTRYYDPETCRFINADSLLTTEDILGFNLFAYCSNNPVNYSDPTGTMKEWVLNGVTYNDNGTVADFHRLEQGRSPLAYEAALQQQKAVMAAATYAEAAAYSTQSKKAVANVIKNRVGTTTVNGKSTRNTIQDVVSEPAQFSSYGNKWYNEAITYYTTGIVENEYDRRVLKETMQAIIPIFTGEEVDITCGCTFFYSPVSMIPQGSVPAWVNGKTEVTIDGVDPRYFRFYK